MEKGIELNKKTLDTCRWTVRETHKYKRYVGTRRGLRIVVNYNGETIGLLVNGKTPTQDQYEDMLWYVGTLEELAQYIGSHHLGCDVLTSFKPSLTHAEIVRLVREARANVVEEFMETADKHCKSKGRAVARQCARAYGDMIESHIWEQETDDAIVSTAQWFKENGLDEGAEEHALTMLEENGLEVEW